MLSSLWAANELSNASNLRVIMPLYGAEELALVEQYLQPGDMVVAAPPKPEMMASGQAQQRDHWIQKAREFKSNHPEIEVIFNFDSIEDMREWVAKLPPEVDWVSYDYERWQWTPEYDADQEHTLRLFKEARHLVHQHGMRLFLTPVPFYSDYAINWAVQRDYLPERMHAWDFGALAETGDAINAQFQYFLKDLAWLQSTVCAMSAELKQEAPNTLFSVQIGRGLGRNQYTDAELRKAIDAIHRSGADAIVVWFGPGQASWAATVLLMLRGEP